MWVPSKWICDFCGKVIDGAENWNLIFREIGGILDCRIVHRDVCDGIVQEDEWCFEYTALTKFFPFSNGAITQITEEVSKRYPMASISPLSDTLSRITIYWYEDTRIAPQKEKI